MEGVREAIEQGKYGDAVKQCKQLLKQDRNNYDGFVLLGLALVRSKQHLDQAEMSFNKAISLRPTALPAYKGMVELREAVGSKEQKVESYKALAKVAKVADDLTLATELLSKAAKTVADDHEQAKVLFQEMLTMQLNDEQRLEALCGLVDSEAGIMEEWIEEHQRQASAKSGSLAAEELRCMAEVAWVKSESSKSLEENTREVAGMLPHSERHQGLLLQILVYRVRACTGDERKTLKQSLLSQSLVMLSVCPTKLAVELLLVLAEEDDAEELFKKVNWKGWLGKQTAHLFPGKGITLAASNLKSPRKQLALWELSNDENSIHGWRVLAREYYREGLLDKSSECASKWLCSIALKRKLFGVSLKASEHESRLLLADILFSQKQHSEASREYLSVTEQAKSLPESRRMAIIKDAFQGLFRLSLAKKETEAARSRLHDILAEDPEDHWALSERGWLEYEARCMLQAKNDLEKAVSACPDSALYHYRLGRVYWDTDGMKEKALPEFLESAKLDPTQPKAFVYLGHCYKDSGKDVRRAVRCYQKAVSLDFENASVGELLCDMLDHDGQTTLERTICEEATSKSPRAFWAWRRLAFIQAAQQAWSEAVRSAQHGLRGYPSDSHLWEALALSYKKLGMFSAALKAFGRALDLDKSSFFAAAETGAIQLMLQMYLKATDAYRQALQIRPGDLTAVYGLASALLGQARERFIQGAFLWCTTLLKEAIDLAGRNRLLSGHLVAAWKQLGDASLMYAQALPFNAELPGKATIDWELSVAVKSWQNERLNAARNAVRAYRHAVHLLPSDGSLYRDLAIAIQYSCTLEKLQVSDHWTEAETVVVSSLQLDGANAETWIALGVVTQHKGVQQHAFIQALRLNTNHALAWAYLGQLYLSLHDKVLAQLCFDRARSADSSLAITWAGMSALESLYGRKDELLEGFANCTAAVQLSSMVDVHGGVGQLAAQTQNLSSAEALAALRQATERQPLRASIHNLKGLSSESRNDFVSAIQAYENARGAALLSSQTAAVQSLITSNLARALSKAGYADAAVSEYNKLFSTGAPTDLNDLRGYAIALKNSGQGQKSELVVKKVLARVTGDTQHVGALLLLARLTYFSKGPVTALNILLDAPYELFSNEELCLTTLAIGISTRNPSLVSAAVNRCRLVFTSKLGPEAYILLGDKNQDSSSLNLHPHSGSLRSAIGQRTLSQSSGEESVLVERLCDSSMITSTDNSTRKLSTRVLTDANLAKHFPPLRAMETLSQLQRALHMEPFNLETRYCLVLFLMQEARRRDFPLFICRTVSRMARSTLPHLSSSYRHSYMRVQLQLCVSECELRDGNFTSALESSKEAFTASKPFPSLKLAAVLQLARCYLSMNEYSAARAAVASWPRDANAGNVLWQISLLELELRWKERPDNEMLRRQSHGDRWIALAEASLAWFNFRRGEVRLSEEMASRALSLWPDNTVLCLFHGAICMTMVKSGTGGLFLQKAISSLGKAVNGKRYMDVPVACALLAQAESSREGTRTSILRKWSHNLRMEFLTWPTEFHVIPAELYFQMALLSKQENVPQADECPENERSWKSWIQRALHLNPACERYWKALQNFTSKSLTTENKKP